MVWERDVLGQPTERPPFAQERLRDRLRATVATLQPLKDRCTDTSDEAYEQVERLEAFLARAERADGLALERLGRELYVNAHKGKQENWKPKEACKDAKAELKALKEAQEQYEKDSNADLAWALRDRLRGFLGAPVGLLALVGVHVQLAAVALQGLAVGALGPFERGL